MKIPETPPDPTAHIKKIVESIRQGEADIRNLMPWAELGLKPYDDKGRYLHWEDLKHKRPPGDLTPEQYWYGTAQARAAIRENLPFETTDGEPFWYCVPSTVTNDLLYVSEEAKGAVEADPVVSEPSTQRTYLISSLIEEAISSSQLEGASTTRRVAKEMIRTGRQPTDKSERMILNNYKAMQFLRKHLVDPLTPSMVFELHTILMDGTIDAGDEDKVGCFRDDADDIVVGDRMTGAPLHVPPKRSELEERLSRLCAFANGEVGDDQMPPLLRAIVVHFMIGYDHPFIDGNGRVARALFFWVVAKANFWLLEYVAISSVLKTEQEAYVRAYLHTETDNNDVTYFIVYQLQVLRKAITRLHEYLARKSRESRETRNVMSRSGIARRLNHRQIALLHHAMQHPGAEYTVRSHQSSHGVANQTARTDLATLADDYGLLTRARDGKRDLFIAPRDIAGRIRRLGTPAWKR
jgi:Fic family protein